MFWNQPLLYKNHWLWTKFGQKQKWHLWFWSPLSKNNGSIKNIWPNVFQEKLLSIVLNLCIRSWAGPYQSAQDLMNKFKKNPIWVNGRTIIIFCYINPIHVYQNLFDTCLIDLIICLLVTQIKFPSYILFAIKIKIIHLIWHM